MVLASDIYIILSPVSLSVWTFSEIEPSCAGKIKLAGLKAEREPYQCRLRGAEGQHFSSLRLGWQNQGAGLKENFTNKELDEEARMCSARACVSDTAGRYA